MIENKKLTTINNTNLKWLFLFLACAINSGTLNLKIT